MDRMYILLGSVNAVLSLFGELKGHWSDHLPGQACSEKRGPLKRGERKWVVTRSSPILNESVQYEEGR